MTEEITEKSVDAGTKLTEEMTEKSGELKTGELNTRCELKTGGKAGTNLIAYLSGT